MKKAVFCLADNNAQAQRIVDHLLSAGFDNEVISVLFADSSSTRGFTETETDFRTPKKGKLAHEKNTKAPEGATTGAITGGIIGGTLGLLAGIGSLAIPGVGPFIAAGPLMAALAGSGVGGSVGLIVGALVGMGVPEYEAKRYENSLKAGGILISVHANTPEEVDQARDIMKREGAKDISTSSEKASSRGR